MRKVNYRSDFDFILRLSDCRGDDIGFPDYDWEARFYTRGNRANAYVASCKGGECVNCFNDGGRVHVVVNSPRLGLGELFVDFKASLPNSIYPDEHQDEMAPLSTGIELVRGAAPCPCSAEVELMLPYVRFRYEDFTPEQIEELKRPATEAAQRADNFVHTASEAEAIRMANEESRVREESERVEREQSRESAEAARRTAETKRAEAEEARKLAETKRATEFATWETEIDGKADRTELSAVTGEPTEGAIEALEPTLITEALRKVPQVLTPQEQAQVKANLAISKMELFCDLFNAAAGNYGYARLTEGVFDCELNKLKLTYEEAVAVYLDGTFDSKSSGGKRFANRTNLPITAYHAIGTIEESFNSDNFVMNVEVANLKTLYTSMGFSAYPISIYNKPFGYAKLRKIIGDIDFHFAKDRINWFVGAVNLEEVSITRLAFSIDLSSCGKLNLQSFQTMIVKANSDNDSGIHPRVITVHPDVYAKLTDESNAEWHKVLTDAAAKNITFATI